MRCRGLACRLLCTEFTLLFICKEESHQDRIGRLLKETLDSCQSDWVVSWVVPLGNLDVHRNNFAAWDHTFILIYFTNQSKCQISNPCSTAAASIKSVSEELLLRVLGWNCLMLKHLKQLIARGYITNDVSPCTAVWISHPPVYFCSS